MNPLPHRAFASWRPPATLNVLAVAASLAGLTGFVFRALMGMNESTLAAISTFIVGTAWAAAVRVPPKRSGVRLGWVLSPVFACANSMLCVALMAISEGKPSFPEAIGMIILGGAFIGAVIWIPALILTLLFFGLPIARAQSLAARGLAGADRGEIVVGLASSALALVPLVARGAWIEQGLSLVAIACGLVAAAFAIRRERARRAFVRRVEAGEVAHFRVEPTAEGKVLVRVTTTGIAYRVSDFVEEIATLDEDGAVLATSRTAL